MDEDRSPDAGDDAPPDPKPTWRVDADATRFELAHDPTPLDPTGASGGRMVYVDEHGRRRRLPPDLSELRREEIAAAADALSSELGAMPVDPARDMALEHLSRLHASGAMSDEDFARERRRLLDYG